MENKDYQKRVAAIHDLSGFGKCSLTVLCLSFPPPE